MRRYGTFITIFIIGFMARSLAGAHKAGGPKAWERHHGSRRGGWTHDEVPEPFRPMLERWHREAHAAPPGSDLSQPDTSDTSEAGTNEQL